MATIPVVVKHQSKRYNVELDPSTSGETFKYQLFSLTGVEPDRQKILVKGGQLKDETDLSKLGVKPGHQFMMMGTASSEGSKVLEPPKEKIKFLEDMTEAEAAQTEGAIPAGLQNLGNTCYMNSTIQTLRSIPELQDELSTYKANDASRSTSSSMLGGTDLTTSLRDLFKRMSETQEGFPPLKFLTALRTAFPQFAQRAKDGHGYAQQDAEEAWSQIVSQLRQKLRTKEEQSSSEGSDSKSKETSFIDKYMAGTFDTEMECSDPAAKEAGEEPVKSHDKFFKLNCHIGGETNHLRDGLSAGLREPIEKRSEKLGRDTMYLKTSKLSRLPLYLPIHMIRFDWRRTTNVKAKIMRKVTFPLEIDAIEFCTEELRKSLIPIRDKIRDIRKEEEDVRRNRMRQKRLKEGHEPETEADKEAKQKSKKPGSEKGKGNQNKTTKTEEPEVPHKTDAEIEEEHAASILKAKKEIISLVNPKFAADVGTNQTGLYELWGVITHQGASADSGHYTAFVKKQGRKDPSTGKTIEEDGKWWWFNDEKVSEVGSEKIETLSGGVLTSHKYGVATVWLVATLGAKSALKKVNRKDILNVNVPKACNTIIAPDAPMALRLQSNLLYGVSRVYAQQCGYVLADAQHAHNTMRTLLKVVKTAQLDSDANKARLDQLILPDDPAFAPELDISLAPLTLDLELSLHAANWDVTPLLPATSSEKGAPRTPQKRKALLTKDGRLTTEFALAAPSSTADAVSAGRRELLGSAQSEINEGLTSGEYNEVGLGDGDGGFLPDAGFEFDIDGNLIDLSSGGAVLRREGVSDASLSAQVRREHEEARRAAGVASTEMRQRYIESDGALPEYDKYYGLPHAEAFPRTVGLISDHHEAAAAAADSSSFAPISTDPAATTEAAAAFNRGKPIRHRKRRILQLDERMQLRNTELAENNANYLANMAAVMEHKGQLKAARQAKENARFWVWGAGIGGVGAGIGSGTGFASVKSPLIMFSGDELKAELLGVSVNELAAGHTGRKHSRESEESGEDGSEEKERRVRSRGEEEGGSRAGVGYADDGVIMAGYDDAIEIPREAPSQLDDISSAMPWNRSASIRGSSLPRSVIRAAATVGGSTSGLSASRRLHPGSRLVSASPLQGRGLGVGPGQGYGRGSHSRGFSDLGLPGDEEMLGTDLPDFDETELYGIETEAAPPVAQMDAGLATAGDGGTAVAATIPQFQAHQLPQAHLDRDAFNFLAFVEDAISLKAQGADIEVLGEEGVEGGIGGAAVTGESVAPTTTRTITLEALLPPRENSATVAAQGLLHTLTLASRNVLKVWQKEPFGEIRMSLMMGTVAGAEGEK